MGHVTLTMTDGILSSQGPHLIYSTWLRLL